MGRARGQHHAASAAGTRTRGERADVEVTKFAVLAEGARSHGTSAPAVPESQVNDLAHLLNVDYAVRVDLLLDRSGSASKQMTAAQQHAATGLAAAARQAEQRTGIFGFTGAGSTDIFEYKPADTDSTDGLAAMSLTRQGGTPTVHAVRHSLTQLQAPEDRHARRALIVLTDGMSDDPKELQEAIAAAREDGIAVIGLGQLETAHMTDSTRALFDAQFGANGWEPFPSEPGRDGEDAAYALRDSVAKALGMARPAIRLPSGAPSPGEDTPQSQDGFSALLGTARGYRR